MNIRFLVAVTLLSLGLSVAAAGEIVSLAYEVPLSEFRAPATANGGASFRECSECERHLVRVKESTHYSINGKSVRLQAFKEALMHATDRDEKTITVLHHLESDTIESIAVSL